MNTEPSRDGAPESDSGIEPSPSDGAPGASRGSTAGEERTLDWTPTDSGTNRSGSQDFHSDGLFDSSSAPGGKEVPGIDIPERLGDYDIQELIGSGGMGQVYLAEHVRMQRTVALKTLPIHRLGDEKAIDRFFAEVRAASRLMHPNIVTAFDAGEQDGVPYLAMEYVDGLTLTAIVAQSGPLPLGEAASVIRQAALGLLHAHRAGIVHRDVKPGNLMRASDGTIKVLDLGLAQMTNLAFDAIRPGRKSSVPFGGDNEISEHKTRKRGRLIGTLSFMSPEQLDDPESVDYRSDIYSLGATLFFLLTGRPPYQGEFLDQVYGHRHGEIPDLLTVRDDADLSFANIFERMMAKSPGQRYNSLDEVIDDLAPYSDTTTTPHWLTELTGSGVSGDHSTSAGGSTFGGESTILRRIEVVGLELGMFETAAASCDLNGELRHLMAGEDEKPSFRMVMGYRSDRLQFESSATQLRTQRPDRCVHCVPMYIGQKTVERSIGGRQCPPEVLLGAMLQRCLRHAWKRKAPPEAVAITVPSIYDQLHRRSILQAAAVAGLRSVRLVDRSLAATQMMLASRLKSESTDSRDGVEHEQAPENPFPISADAIDPSSRQNVLFVGLTGQANEVTVIRQENGRLQQLGTAGHWHHGTLAWLGRLVDLAAEAFIRSIDLDPRKSLRRAARLQIACERAMHTFVMLPTVKIGMEAAGRQVSVEIRLAEWLDRCGDLIDALHSNVALACKRAGLTPAKIDHCLTLGPLLRLPEIHRVALQSLPESVQVQSTDRNDVACGAAACLAAELPGRGDIPMPPRNVTSQSIGILIEDERGRRRILPIIPRGALLPARTNRRINAAEGKSKLTLSLVETSGHQGDDWQSLGRHEFDVPSDGTHAYKSRMIGFEVDINGMLTVRAQTPGVPGSTKLRPLPEPSIAEADLPGWTEWLADQP